ncbi:MAG: hypothetical protein J6G98_02535 [Bacilli bacterium]|nr:hypothetical protein [Bacilli bacterium]
MIDLDHQDLMPNIEMIADELIRDIKNDPLSYRKDITSIEGLNTSEEYFMLEKYLMKKMPNLIITHHETDTPEDLSNQLKSIKNILLNNMQPYFIDFPNSKQNVKKR